MKKTLFIGIMILFSSTAFAGMYSWVDENGVKRFSNSPPPAQVENVKVAPEIQYDARADQVRMQQDAMYMQRKEYEWAQRDAMEAQRAANEAYARAAVAERQRQEEALKKEIQKAAFAAAAANRPHFATDQYGNTSFLH